MQQVHVQLAPGERLASPAARDALARRFEEDPRLGALLLPLVPRGDGWFPRAARRHLAAWDARFLHPMNYFAPAARVASRVPLPGHRNADAAPHLAALLEARQGVDTALDTGVDTPVARDLGAWVGWAREEGRAWGALARRDARFRGFLPAVSPAGWWRHNVLEAPHRLVEVHQALRRPAAGVWLLHAAREAAWTKGCMEGYRG